MREYIPIKPETVKRFAHQARRLGGVVDDLTTDQMLRIFSSIEVGYTPSNRSLIANMKIAENQGIIPAVTTYTNNVTMEGESV